MDLLSIKPATVSVEIRHPGTNEPLGIVFECVSLESDQVKAVERRIRNAALKSGRNTLSAERIEQNTVEILAAAIVGWTWPDGLELDGDKKPAFNRANVLKALSAPWLAKQIDNALGDETAFFAKSAAL